MTLAHSQLTIVLAAWPAVLGHLVEGVCFNSHRIIRIDWKWMTAVFFVKFFKKLKGTEVNQFALELIMKGLRVSIKIFPSSSKIEIFS